uniref:Uncharacterized protein LOC111103756 isoform X1 n=1 Tax=Crassostrea virginica TaxID=6565 RepID=A0A8B8AN12_CRAVI|nr:uncharacterized protein LOC111103756 isoform X1 [Crassostrea virginica]
MIANIKVLIIILFIPYTEGEMYSLFTVNSRFSGFLLEKISPMGMEMCVKECAKRGSCASLNFHRGRLECELSHSDATANPEGMTSKSEYIYIDRSHIPQKYFDACSASCSTSSCCVSTATGPKCVKSECPAHHPDANFTNVKVTSTSIGTTLFYTCFGNQSITLTSICKADGTWTSSASSCPQYKPPDCFETNTSCWFQFNFTHDNSSNGCPGGTRFVRRTQYSSAPYVGVILCSETRYKIMLGLKLNDTFQNIVYSNGGGMDHCELVEGYELGAAVSYSFMYITGTNSAEFWRNNWGEQFSTGNAGYYYTYYSTNLWYECGVCIPEALMPACFNSTPSCWYEYDFAHDDIWNGCAGGRKYVMRTRFTSAPLVGVVLCSSSSYQIFLGTNLTDTFLNVIDGSGQGENLCELVGGHQEYASPWNYGVNAPNLTGYARNFSGEEFHIQSIVPGSGWSCPSSYYCGVNIPGPKEPDCMSSTPSCWYTYNEWLYSSSSGCNFGQVLVRRTNYTSAPFLAVQLCNSTRYKIFLSSSLGGPFEGIEDGNGYGEDHCELVGGSENTAITKVYNYTYTYLSYASYYRNNIGEQFTFKYGSVSNYVSYYECGISIPGTDIVV